MSQQQADLFVQKQLADSMCTAEKQVRLFLWKVSEVSITFVSRMRPPSDMLSSPAAADQTS